MNATPKFRSALIASAIAVAAVGSLWAETANAQMFREPFSFSQRNQASMAVYMHQQGRSSSGSGATITGSGPSQTLVCGSTGPNASTAAGNILCVIAGDNTNVLVSSDQDANGDQTSTATTNQTAADEIGEILNGEPQG